MANSENNAVSFKQIMHDHSFSHTFILPNKNKLLLKSLLKVRTVNLLGS